MDVQDIDPRFFDTPYFLAPEKPGVKAYVLLRTALEQTGLAGVAKVVIRPPREHLALLKPLDGLLLMETLHFADELRDPSELDDHKAAVGQKELDMALSLVKTMAGKWEPEKYHDEYREGLMDLIEKKAKVGPKGLPAPARAKDHGKVIDLVSLLQESLGHTSKSQKQRKTKYRAAHKKAA